MRDINSIFNQAEKLIDETFFETSSFPNELVIELAELKNPEDQLKIVKFFCNTAVKYFICGLR